MEKFQLVEGKLVKVLPDGVRIELTATEDGGIMLKTYHTGYLVCRREITLRDMLGGHSERCGREE